MKNLKEKLQKKFADAKGFTLIELIVVIAILGILTAIAVPTYTAYIDRANEAADETTLDAVQTAVYATYATEGTVTEITVKSDTITATLDDGTEYEDTATNEDFLEYYYGEYDSTTEFSIDFQSDEYANGATWTSGGSWAGISE